MMNRFKGLDLVDGVSEELMDREVHNIVQETVTKIITLHTGMQGAGLSVPTLSHSPHYPSL